MATTSDLARAAGAALGAVIGVVDGVDPDFAAKRKELKEFANNSRQVAIALLVASVVLFILGLVLAATNVVVPILLVSLSVASLYGGGNLYLLARNTNAFAQGAGIVQMIKSAVNDSTFTVPKESILQDTVLVSCFWPKIERMIKFRMGRVS